MTDKTLDFFFFALAALGGLLACLTYTGCHTYTVVPADREVLPVAPCEDGRFEVTEDGATGWYVPDAVMLELLEAE